MSRANHRRTSSIAGCLDLDRDMGGALATFISVHSIRGGSSKCDTILNFAARLALRMIGISLPLASTVTRDAP